MAAARAKGVLIVQTEQGDFAVIHFKHGFAGFDERTQDTPPAI